MQGYGIRFSVLSLSLKFGHPQAKACWENQPCFHELTLVILTHSWSTTLITSLVGNVANEDATLGPKKLSSVALILCVNMSENKLNTSYILFSPDLPSSLSFLFTTAVKIAGIIE